MDTHLLPDGTLLEIRAIRADDGERLRASHARLSPESRYRRFLGAKPILSESDARYLVQVDGRDHFALVATTVAGPEPGAIVAVTRFVRLPDEPGIAEFAIVVADAHQRQGLASALMRRLAAAAVEREVNRFRATMLADNLAIQRMLEHLAVGRVDMLRSGNVTEVEITLPDPDRLTAPAPREASGELEAAA